MLYTNSQLKSSGFNHKVAMERYLHKYLNQKNEFRRLKPHEKDYAFGWMCVTRKEDGTPAFDLYEDVEAQEYVFLNIVLTYGEDVDRFASPIYGPYGELTQAQIQRDHDYFDYYLPIWKKLVEDRRGPYLSIIAPMLSRKLRELKEVCSSEDEYNSRERYCYGVFFYIYYKAKLCFEENNKRSLIFKIKGYELVINIYTFCHIFTRHYVPSMNKGLPNTMNSNIPYIDIHDFSESLKNLIILYFTKNNGLNISTEYLLFKFMNTPYILWLKYKNLVELSGNKGFEIRSFYRCEEEIDLSRFNGRTEVILSEGCVCCI